MFVVSPHLLALGLVVVVVAVVFVLPSMLRCCCILCKHNGFVHFSKLDWKSENFGLGFQLKSQLLRDVGLGFVDSCLQLLQKKK